MRKVENLLQLTPLQNLYGISATTSKVYLAEVFNSYFFLLQPVLSFLCSWVSIFYALFVSRKFYKMSVKIAYYHLINKVFLKKVPIFPLFHGYALSCLKTCKFARAFRISK